MPPTECIYQVSNWYLKARLKKSGKLGRTDGRTDGHCHSIIRPFFKRAYKNAIFNISLLIGIFKSYDKQRVLMHGHQGWNVQHGLCHIYMIYVYIWVVYSFCLFCCLFIIVTTQFVALYKPCKPKPKPSTYDPPDNHPLAEIQIPILRPEPKQQICHQHANTDHFSK